MAVLAQHDHVITFATTTGSDWLWVVVLGGVLVTATGVVLRPVVADTLRPARLLASVAAMVVALIALLLAPGLVLPPRVTGLVVVATGAAVAAARHHVDAPVPPWVRGVRTVAPAVVVTALVATAAALLAAWLSPPGADVGPLLFTGLLLGLAGLAWTGPCVPRSRPASVVVHGGGWLLAQAVSGATAVTAIAALPG